MKHTEKRKEVSQIRGQYDYMDKLPFRGWAWEFVRRNEKYIDAFIELEKLASLGVWNASCRKRFSELVSVTAPAAMFFRGKLNKTDSGNYLEFIASKDFIPGLLERFGLTDKPFFPKYGIHDNPLFISLKKDFENIDDTIIPRSEKRYIDFAQPPRQNARKKDYKFYRSFKDLLNSDMDFDANSGNRIPNLERDDEDIFYISVSKDAKITDLKKSLLTDISKYLNKKTPKVRQRKWKYYLIVYDLKQKFKDNITYDEIGDILSLAYPNEAQDEEKFCSDRNINNWHDKARSLINGGYAKYLKQTTIQTK